MILEFSNSDYSDLLKLAKELDMPVKRLITLLLREAKESTEIIKNIHIKKDTHASYNNDSKGNIG